MNEAKKNSVLIVDDENSNIIALTHILSQEYTVYAAKSGQNAIIAAEKYLPDVVLLDIIMPDMDGYAVIAELKNSPKTNKIPVIFITGLSNASDEEKGLALGASDYIAKPFSPAIVKLRVNNQIKMLENLHTIERLSMIDQLTDLPNRRSFDFRLKEEWERAMREQTPISILILDVDNFKNYNDTYGHQQGDVALQAVAKIIVQSLKRSADFTSRWGGEEFVALLPCTDLAGAMTIAEQMRINVENAVIPCVMGSDTKITISIGINTELPPWYSTYDSFISEAHKALYRAKEAGRNRICACELKN